MTMKFFNWMHRKLLHPSVVYSKVPQKQQPDVFNDVKESEADEAVLLSNVLDAILTIGTLDNSLIQFEYDKRDKQDQDQEQEVKELVLPIVAAKPAIKLNDQNDEKKRNVEKVVIFELKNNNVQNSHKEHMTEPLLKEDKEKKEGKRITLADLFAEADPPAKKGSLSSKEKSAKTKYIASKWKHNKKVVHEKREEKPMPKINTTTSSAKQAQRLITKVLKKKVHPEMGVGGAMKETKKDKQKRLD